MSEREQRTFTALRKAIGVAFLVLNILNIMENSAKNCKSWLKAALTLIPSLRFELMACVSIE